MKNTKSITTIDPRLERIQHLATKVRAVLVGNDDALTAFDCIYGFAEETLKEAIDGKL